MVNMAFCISFLLLFPFLYHPFPQWFRLLDCQSVTPRDCFGFCSLSICLGGQNPNFDNLLSWGVMERIEIVEGR